jgi:hypothetical protein
MGHVTFIVSDCTGMVDLDHGGLYDGGTAQAEPKRPQRLPAPGAHVPRLVALSTPPGVEYAVWSPQ